MACELNKRVASGLLSMSVFATTGTEEGASGPAYCELQGRLVETLGCCCACCAVEDNTKPCECDAKPFREKCEGCRTSLEWKAAIEWFTNQIIQINCC